MPRRLCLILLRGIWPGGSPAPGPEAVPPFEAAGRVDPLSALWRVVRGGAAPCTWNLPVQDGARRPRMTLGQAAGQTPLTGAGSDHRIAGFAPADMAERQSFPFTATHAAQEAAFVLTEVAGMSLFGPIRILRRD